MIFSNKKICIAPDNWRYKVAQCVLSLLYGRKWHYISPWKHASIGTGIFIMHNKKLLVTKRAPHLEYPNVFCIPGGHIDIETGESMLDGLAREVKEELSIDLDLTHINERQPIDIYYKHSQKYHEIKDAGHISATYIIDLPDLPDAQLSSEVTEIRWVNFEEIKKLRADNNYVGVFPTEDIFK